MNFLRGTLATWPSYVLERLLEEQTMVTIIGRESEVQRGMFQTIKLPFPDSRLNKSIYGRVVVFSWVDQGTE